MRDMIRLGQVDPVRKRISDATQALLGDTIMLSDAQWSGPSRLPGWTRAQVASHISRSADAMRHLTLASLEGRQRPLYPSASRRLTDMELGADKSGLEQQIDLDTAAEALAAAFAQVTDWLVIVRLPIGELPLSALTLARFHEVVLHHIDLDTGYTCDRLDPISASWLLQWAAIWLRSKPGQPNVELTSESGVVELIGEGPDPLRVDGTDIALWAWLTGRGDADHVSGADGLRWPLLG